MTRLERLQGLLDFYGQTVHDYASDCEEDLRPYFGDVEEPERECHRWCCITQHNEKVFFLPTFDSKYAAMNRATEFAADDIFAESPVAVVNLDTGHKLLPIFDSIRWRIA